MHRRRTGLGLAVKRGIDVLAALALLLITWPLQLIIAAAIKATSSGPVLFRQQRLGRGGALFSMLKFRSMYQGSELVPADRAGYRYEEDPRVTRVGRLLRRTSLDELPQLFNILRGEMSLVGPRPALPHHLQRYSAEERRRLLFRPGVTGLAQVSGRNSIPWEERIRYDLQYVEHWSLWLDLKILFRTLRVVLNREGTAITYSWGRCDG